MGRFKWRVSIVPLISILRKNINVTIVPTQKKDYIKNGMKTDKLNLLVIIKMGSSPK